MTFHEIEIEYRTLRAQFDAGQLSEADLRGRLEQLMIQDDQSRWWIIGYETGLWYVHDGETWVQAAPPLAAKPVVEKTVAPVPPPATLAPAAPPGSVAPAPDQPRRSNRRLAGLLGLIAVVVVSVGVFFILQQRGTSTRLAGVTITPTQAPVAAETAVLVAAVDTPAAEATAEPTQRPTLVPTDTSIPPTLTPSDTSVPPTATSTDTLEPLTLTPTPVPPTFTPTRTPTSVPVPPTLRPVLTQRLAPGVIADFATFGTWVRGDESYGTLTQTREVAHDGQTAARLDYDFPAVAKNYVVFRARPAIAIDGKPTAISLWVYGDASGHFLNTWISDSQGEVRQFTFGQVAHTGWQEMTATLDVNAGWPQGLISGKANGQLDYPVSLFALILDGVPDGAASAGTIYLDEMRVAAQ